MTSLAPIPAVGIICFRGSDVLLIKRGTPPKIGEWSIPGGRIEAGETQEEAALRELFEETQIRGKLLGKVAEIDADFGTHHYTLHDYLTVYKSGEPRAGDDAAHAEFISPERLKSLPMWETTKAVIESARTMLDGLINTNDETSHIR